MAVAIVSGLVHRYNKTSFLRSAVFGYGALFLPENTFFPLRTAVRNGTAVLFVTALQQNFEANFVYFSNEQK